MKIIKGSIEMVINDLGLKTEVVLEHPRDEEWGDYSTNVAMVLAKKLGKNPRELAEDIAEKLREVGNLVKIVENIEVAGGGFINFTLREDWLVKEMKRMIDMGQDYGKGEWGKGKRMLIDYSSPNIAKDFSVGHLRSTIIGQAVRNLYEYSGWETVGDNHLGDWGTQFGMIIAAVEESGKDISSMSVQEMESLYVDYNKQVKEDESKRDKAREAFVRLEEGDRQAREIWQAAKDASIAEFDKIYERLDVDIENAYGESHYEEIMKDVIDEAKEKGLAVGGEGGALIIELEGLPPAMLIKSDGGTTYLTRDLATIKFREESPELKSDLYIYEVGAEQTVHFRQLFRVAEKMGWGEEAKFYHLAHGLVLGKDGKKLSTRKGTSEKLLDLIDNVVEKAKSINPETAEVVGVGAVKYADLKHSPESDYVFDMEEMVKLEGNSGPYLQYTYARAKSVLRKAGDEKPHNSTELNSEEMAIVRWLYRFSEVVEEATREYAPNKLANYLYELSTRYNTFYNQHKIVGSEEEGMRVGITKSVAQILKNGLGILGIEAPEKM